MNTIDIIQYGHQHVLDSLKGLARLEWETPGVCGVWSVKDIVAHLATFEYLLNETILQLINPAIETPTVRALLSDEVSFNDDEVVRRQAWEADETLADYVKAGEISQELLPQLPPAVWQKNGTIAWYGPNYSLNDFIVYTSYGHKREHVAQIELFRTRLRQQAPAIAL